MTQMLSGSAVVAVRRQASLVLPPRTFLYHLAPHASESIWCESLTGYINRLAWTHHVSPRALVAQVINPLLPSPVPFVAAFGLQPAMGLNGNGAQVSTWANVVGQLTGRTDLERLTFVPFLGDFLSHRFLRKTPAWCPTCLAEWKAAERPLYQPLLWMLQLVTHCPIHHQLLVDRCPTCDKRQKVLATDKTRPFECTSCASWLGKESKSPLIGEETVLRWQTWLFSVLEELHIASQKGGSLSWQVFFTQLSSYLREQRGASRRLALALGTSPANFHRQVTHQNVVLQTLLAFCYRCEVTPWQVMQGQFEALDRVLQENTCQPAPLPPRFTHRLDQDVALEYLLATLKTSGDPPSLKQVALEVGSDATLLARYFPEECAQVIRRHAEYRNRRKEQRTQNLREGVRQAVFSLYARGEYPLRYKLSSFFPNGAMRLSEATEAWREAMVELGLDPDNPHKAQMRLTQNSD